MSVQLLQPVYVSCIIHVYRPIYGQVRYQHDRDTPYSASSSSLASLSHPNLSAWAAEPWGQGGQMPPLDFLRGGVAPLDLRACPPQMKLLISFKEVSPPSESGVGKTGAELRPRTPFMQPKVCKNFDLHPPPPGHEVFQGGCRNVAFHTTLPPPQLFHSPPSILEQLACPPPSNQTVPPPRDLPLGHQ